MQEIDFKRSEGGANNCDALTKILITALIRRHVRRLDAIAKGYDVRGELGGCRATRYNRRRRMAKSLGSAPTTKEEK